MKRISFLLLLFLGVLITSCNKDHYMELKPDEENSSSKMLSTTYGVTPSLSTFTPNSSGNLVGSCGTFQGGVVKAKVTAISGSNVTIALSTTNGLPFPAGYFYVKSKSACGSVLGTMIGNTSLNFVSVTVNVSSLSTGLLHLYPVYITNLGQRYWSEPILVWTSPVMNSGSLYNGFLYGTVDGVNVLCSGSTNTSSTSANQCTQFCKNYYSSVYGMNVWLSSGTVSCGSTINAACNWYYTASARGLTAYANGGSVAPRVGDVLVFKKTGAEGHVMIITEVSANQVKVAHQNGGTSTAPISGAFTRTASNTITPWTGYTTLGWLRKA